MKRILTLAIFGLLLLSSISVAYEVIPQGYYLYIPIQVSQLSALVYSVSSNATVAVYVMTQSQFSAFNSSESVSYIVNQNGTSVVDGLLLNPGTYYLVIYSPYGVSNISYNYNVLPITPQNSSTYVCLFVVVPPYGYYSLFVHESTLGSPSNLSIFYVSNESVYLTVLNNGSQVVFNSSANTLSLSNIGLCYNISLPIGLYYIHLYNPNPIPAYVAIGYRDYPYYVNPYLQFEINRPQGVVPVGIASYGVSGTTPYVIKTSSVAGYFNISSILAYNGSQSLASPYSASLQLNSVLVVKNNDNSTQIYWPQDFLIFITNESIVAYRNNVLNITNPTATLTNSSIISKNGYVAPSSQGQYYYGNYNTSPVLSYNLPFAGILEMNESVIKGKGVEISFSVIVLENGTSPVLSTMTFDKVLIVDPNVSSACFEVNGKGYTPAGIHGVIGMYYDTELVFGGGGNGEITNFESLDAVLGLYYLKGSEYVTFPSYYDFGADTAEATHNLTVKFTPQGQVIITNGGNLDLIEYNVSGQYVLNVKPFIPPVTTTTSQPYSSTSSQPYSSTSLQSYSSTYQSAQQYSSTTTQGVLSYIPIAGIVLVIAAVLGYLMNRKRK